MTWSSVDVGQHLAERGQRGDPQLRQQARDPGVVVGARPLGVGVLPGEVRRQLARGDPVGVDLGLRDGAAAEPVADGGELLVGELEQPGGEGEAAVEVARVLLGHGALVADVVLELRPRVLQHGAHLDLRGGPPLRATWRCRLA